MSSFSTNVEYIHKAQRILYPERFAMENLGHSSKVVHRAYAKRAQMNIPCLEEYESLQTTTGLMVDLPISRTPPSGE